MSGGFVGAAFLAVFEDYTGVLRLAAAGGAVLGLLGVAMPGRWALMPAAPQAWG